MTWMYFLTHFLPMAVITAVVVGMVVYYYVIGSISYVFTKRGREKEPNKTLRSVT